MERRRDIPDLVQNYGKEARTPEAAAKVIATIKNPQAILAFTDGSFQSQRASSYAILCAPFEGADCKDRMKRLASKTVKNFKKIKDQKAGEWCEKGLYLPTESSTSQRAELIAIELVLELYEELMASRVERFTATSTTVASAPSSSSSSSSTTAVVVDEKKISESTTPSAADSKSESKTEAKAEMKGTTILDSSKEIDDLLETVEVRETLLTRVPLIIISDSQYSVKSLTQRESWNPTKNLGIINRILDKMDVLTKRTEQPIQIMWMGRKTTAGNAYCDDEADKLIVKAMDADEDVDTDDWYKPDSDDEKDDEKNETTKTAKPATSVATLKKRKLIASS